MTYYSIIEFLTIFVFFFVLMAKKRGSFGMPGMSNNRFSQRLPSSNEKRQNLKLLGGSGRSIHPVTSFQCLEPRDHSQTMSILKRYKFETRNEISSHSWTFQFIGNFTFSIFTKHFDFQCMHCFSTLNVRLQKKQNKKTRREKGEGEAYVLTIPKNHRRPIT